jgi:AbrB family looped-hinge helix DNA binding protein
MIIKTVKVSDKGQIAIPSTIRKLNNINRGDDLIMIQENGKILIEKATEKIKDDFSDLLKHSESVAKDLWDNKKDEIWNEL